MSHYVKETVLTICKNLYPNKCEDNVVIRRHIYGCIQYTVVYQDCTLQADVLNSVFCVTIFYKYIPEVKFYVDR